VSSGREVVIIGFRSGPSQGDHGNAVMVEGAPERLDAREHSSRAAERHRLERGVAELW
jgi:hypothetical protein